ncbi:hypothetical protein EUBHAL_02944 [Anaerobutyricum hallii DSM 3353]|uniref:Uncharacterized protein n=1 Tax=Anaerobutyricum hallii DSM 3353 TaxID=411469 RepID=C0EZT3_9FIRM|nr:hypothetical protein EUBHAL_02944 [Anaerobutyricum hallii DSM 3353]
MFENEGICFICFLYGNFKNAGGFTKALCETSEERKRVAGEG